MTTPHTQHPVPRHPHAWIGWVVASQLLVVLLWWRLGWHWGVPALLLSHALFVVPVFLPWSGFYGPALVRLADVGQAVWLTIDDGPSDDTVPILDLLDRHGARATFFLVGARAQARPELVQEILRRGHGIGNHSHTHPQAHFWRLGPRAMAREIDAAQQALAQVAGAAPRWFRSVVGMTNPFVAASLRRHGLVRVAWCARGYDAVDGDPDRVLRRIESGLAPGAIVLLHEGAPHGASVRIVEAGLERLAERGYRSVVPPA